jgi:hypothetical protein
MPVPCAPRALGCVFATPAIQQPAFEPPWPRLRDGDDMDRHVRTGVVILPVPEIADVKEMAARRLVCGYECSGATLAALAG